MLKTLGRHAALVGALCAAATGSASAGVVDFEDVAPPAVFVPGESFVSGGVTFTLTGADIGVVDSAAAFLFGNAPLGASGNFYAGLNDFGWVTLSGGNVGLVQLNGFDFGFLAPVPGSGFPGFGVGMLMAVAIDASGAQVSEAWDFGNANGDGDFSFLHVGAGDLGALAGAVQNVTFMACLYDQTGACVTPAGNLAQFALDNIDISVPEPTTLFATMAGLGLLAASRRRRSA